MHWCAEKERKKVCERERMEYSICSHDKPSCHTLWTFSDLGSCYEHLVVSLPLVQFTFYQMWRKPHQYSSFHNIRLYTKHYSIQRTQLSDHNTKIKKVWQWWFNEKKKYGNIVIFWVIAKLSTTVVNTLQKSKDEMKKKKKNKTLCSV